MALEKSTPQILVVKKRKRHTPSSGHGAWKVAYADFVTAMMAFFLLLWLLNVTTDDQRKGIADYFAPENVSRSTSGAGSILAGKSLADAALPRSGGGILLGIPASPAGAPANEEAPDTTDPPPEVDNPVVDAVNAGPTPPGPTSTENASAGASEQQLREALADRQDAEFAAAEQALNAAFDGVAELKPLRDNIIVDRTDEGLRIQIVDQDKAAMFLVGSPQPNAALEKLVGLLAGVVAHLPNPIVITGHTDSLPYPPGAVYTNWELSIDRANACRRALIAAGLAPQQIMSVMGKADAEPLAADPADPRNRRISLVLLRDQTWSRPGSTSIAAPPAPSPSKATHG
jgi:chemotaxis protein MotB